MRTRTRRCVMALMFAAFFAGGVAFEFRQVMNPASYAARPPSSVRTHHRDTGAPTTNPAYPPGVPAITPTLALTTSASRPAFTVHDLRAFMNAHPYPSADGATPRIVRIGFMTASQASALMNGESVGRPPMALVGVVELHGNFSRVVDGIAIGSAPARTWGTPVAPPPPAHDAITVFDARTGNVLVSGYND